MEDLRYQVDLLTALNQKLKNNERMYQMIVDTSNRAFLYVHYDTGVVKTVGKWDNYFSYRINDPKELSRLVDSFSQKSRDDFKRILYIEKEGKLDQTLECLFEDEKTWLEVMVNVRLDNDGKVAEKVIAFRDNTILHNRRDELTYMAYYDYLTNLYNRNYFISRLKEFIEKAERENTIVSVIMLDIDDFHKVSDTRGIVFGDEVIQALGLFLHELTDFNVIGSRFDSDIYCLAVYDPRGHRSVDTIYRSIKDFLSNPIKLTDGSDVSISVSVGVAEYPEASDSVMQLINCAEIVMLKAKEVGKNTIRFFDTSILRKFIEDVKLENMLKEAIHHSNFFLHFQPQYYAKAQRLRGVEALVRWQDGDGTLISPSVFIPIAEKTGNIIPIGDYVMEESIKTITEWKKKFGYPLILSINISAIQYKRADFVPKVMGIINKYNCDPKDIELEITESILIDDFSLVVSKMHELRDYGIKVSLDDFGTGFSSLSYLRGLPIDTLKIDKSFIDSVSSDESARVIADAIVSLSKRLGFETVAEGVETKEQLDFLNSVSCDLIQGYFLGKPMDRAGIEELLLRLI